MGVSRGETVVAEVVTFCAEQLLYTLQNNLVLSGKSSKFKTNAVRTNYKAS